MRYSRSAFTLVELMVASVVFTIGFIGAYLLVESGNSLAVKAKNDIVAASVLREQYELVKNLRDSDWIQLRNWDSIEPYKVTDPRYPIDSRTRLESGYYVIESNFDLLKPLRISRLPDTWSPTSATIVTDMSSVAPVVRLCLDSHGRYVHACPAGARRLPYASYFRVEPLSTTDAAGVIPVADAWKFTFSFVSVERGYRLYEVSAILSDWKQ
ncbi:MAG TPA: prepilin-type N-terminal cleavage/methylation domain-containing protein [bacterium]|nr:prepilin-type N-terminal cleavage/methylation domain-containing protein [bacterium]